MRFLLKFLKYTLILFFLGCISVIVIFTYYTRELQYELPKILSVELYDKDGEVMVTLNNSNRQSYVSLDQIDEDVKKAFISIEDKRFYDHQGIDIIRIGGAIISNLRAKSIVEGASTITQQYARNLYLNQNKEYKRKVQEMMIAINLETKYSKDEIFEGYLNTIYFDSGVYGIEDASMFYFNKPCNNLSLSEACILAAIPKGPSYYSPIKNFENNQTRKNLILEELYKDEKISKQEMEYAKNENPIIYGKLDKINDTNAPYYQDTIINELNKLGILQYYQNQNLKVYTSLDSKLHNAVISAVDKYFPKNEEDLQIAIFAMDSNTKEVLSIVGGKEYKSSTYNRATNSLRQPGSTIKPFLYYTALEMGFTPATTMYSGQTDFYVNGQKYSPQNFGNLYPDRDVTMAYALAASDNIYALKTHLFLGTNCLVDTLKQLNFTSNIENNLSLALGTNEVYLSELVNGYSSLGSLGLVGECVYITKITDQEDKIIYLNNSPINQVLDSTTCYILSETMTNVFDNNLRINMNVTGSLISGMLNHKYAAKSGSTDFDNLMVGYNSQITLGIWTGYDDNKLVSNAKTKFIKYIWADIMESYMQTKQTDGWYQKPNDVIAIALNPVTGQHAGLDEYEKYLYFNINNIPWYIFFD